MSHLIRLNERTRMARNLMPAKNHISRYSRKEHLGPGTKNERDMSATEDKGMGRGRGTTGGMGHNGSSNG